MRRLGLLGSVLADRRLGRIMATYAVSALTEMGTWVAISVWAFQRGGVAEAGLAGFIQLVPAALVAPLAGYAGDRFRRDLVYASGLALVGLASIGTGAAMIVDAPAAMVYGLGAVTAAALTVGRPAIGGLLPAIAENPEKLTAGNALVELIDNAGMFVGPAVAAALMGVGSEGLVFLVLGVATAVAAPLAIVRSDRALLRPTGSLDELGVLDELRGGLRTATRDPGVAVLLVLMSLLFFLAGALDIVVVSVAIDQLGGTSSLAGVLAAALGAGGLIGAGFAIGFTGGSGMRGVIVGSGLISGLPLLVLVVTDGAPLALAVLAVSGLGQALLAVMARTLVQRTTADDVLVRVFGLVESASQLGLALGALGFAGAASAWGTDVAFVVVAAMVPLGVLASWPVLGRLDRKAVAVDHRLVVMLRELDLFAPLSPPAIEQVALNLRPVRAAAGDLIIRKGDHGDRFYMIESGSVVVRAMSGEVVLAGRGAFFGEIALLRDVPRTAAVEAREPTRLWSLGRRVFLEAVTGHPVVDAELRRVADDRQPSDPT